MTTPPRSLAALSAALLALSGCALFDPGAGPRGEPPLQYVDRPLLLEDLAAADEPTGAEEPQVAPETPVAPVPRIAGDEMCSFELRGQPLGEALHLIAAKAGVNMYLDAGLAGQVDASFPSVTVDSALQAILARQGMTLVEDPPGIYWARVTDGSQASSGRFTLRSTNAAEMVANLTSLVDGETKVVADVNQNMVVVRGSQSDVDMVAEYIEAVDRLKPQVLVEVSLFEVTLGDDFELGVSHELTKAAGDDTISILQNLAQDDSFELIFDSPGDVKSTITALQRYVGVDLISTPRVMAVTNTEALIEVILEVPYIRATSTTSSETAGIGSTTVEEVQFKEAGMTMRLTPIIQESGVIQIRIDQELSEVVDYFNSIPILDRRHLSTTLMVHDKQTIVLGGLMQDRASRIDRGVPILMHVPIIGRLFRADQDSVDKRELLIFLTPRVIDSSAVGALEESYKDHYRGRWNEMKVRAGPGGSGR